MLGFCQQNRECFFTEENVAFIQALITKTIAQTYSGKKVVIPKEDIKRTMQKIYEDQIETVPKMNRRVVMDLVRSFIDYTEETEKVNTWNDSKWDASLGLLNGCLSTRSFYTPKLKQNLNYSRQNGGRFHFTY